MTWATFAKAAYAVAREWGMQPSEFWNLSPAEYWAEFDSKVRAARRLQELADGGKPGKAKGSAFSSAEWDDARRRFRERKAAAK